MRRRHSSPIGAVLTGTALVIAGCGSGDPGPAPQAGESSTTAAQAAATAAQTTAAQTAAAPATAEKGAVPDEVRVCQPGLVDTAATVDDVPKWPGPKPADFMTITPSSGTCGTLTGEDARVVYEAALDNPGAILEEGQQPGDPAGGLWGLDTVVVLLSVEPIW